MNIFLNLLGITAFAAVVLIMYSILNAYVLKKIKINKWVVGAAALAMLLLPGFIQIKMPYDAWRYITSGLVVIFMLWFLDLSGWKGFGGRAAKNRRGTTTVERYNKGKDIVIKPKAKPNRVKNNKQ